jgi:hypothetical protein
VKRTKAAPEERVATWDTKSLLQYIVDKNIEIVRIRGNQLDRLLNLGETVAAEEVENYRLALEQAKIELSVAQLELLKGT